MNHLALLDQASVLEDEDCRQTYLLLRLEGLEHEEAMTRSTVSRAQPLHSNSSQRGPVDAAGRRPITIAFLNEAEQTRTGKWLGTFDHLQPYTLDTRSLEERETDAERSIYIDELLDELNPTEAEVICRIYGLRGHPGDQTYDDIADELGRSRGSIAQFGWRARRRLRALLEAR